MTVDIQNKKWSSNITLAYKTSYFYIVYIMRPFKIYGHMTNNKAPYAKEVTHLTPL